MHSDSNIDRWMAACDVAITKATRKTAFELNHLGVPSVSLSHRLNEMDDLRVAKVSTNTFLFASDVDKTSLAGHIVDRYRRASALGTDSLESKGIMNTALRIVSYVERARVVDR
jgi:hypothetical protein